MQNSLAYTIADASARSGIGRTAIYEMINTGQLAARKRRRRTLPIYSSNYYPGRSTQPTATQIYWTKLEEYSSKPTFKPQTLQSLTCSPGSSRPTAKETTMHNPLAHSIAEASARSGIGRTAIYELINTGQLPARKRGRRTLILAEDLRRCLQSLPSVQVNPGLICKKEKNG